MYPGNTARPQTEAVYLTATQKSQSQLECPGAGLICRIVEAAGMSTAMRRTIPLALLVLLSHGRALAKLVTQRA